MIARRLRITGKVQGVFYRAWFAEKAQALGLDGWVRNRADGSVEAVVRGTTEMIEAIVAGARVGSPASRVADIVATSRRRGWKASKSARRSEAAAIGYR